MDSELLDLILGVANELNERLEHKILVDRCADAPLYGQEGVLDSLSLVVFIVAVEQAIEEKLAKRIILANERALSQRHSPFQTIGALAEYSKRLIQGDGSVG